MQTIFKINSRWCDSVLSLPHLPSLSSHVYTHTNTSLKISVSVSMCMLMCAFSWRPARRGNQIHWSCSKRYFWTIRHTDRSAWARTLELTSSLHMHTCTPMNTHVYKTLKKINVFLCFVLLRQSFSLLRWLSWTHFVDSAGLRLTETHRDLSASYSSMLMLGLQVVSLHLAECVFIIWGDC